MSLSHSMIPRRGKHGKVTRGGSHPPSPGVEHASFNIRSQSITGLHATPSVARSQLESAFAALTVGAATHLCQRHTPLPTSHASASRLSHRRPPPAPAVCQPISATSCAIDPTSHRATIASAGVGVRF
jgi:hypothetical protein